MARRRVRNSSRPPLILFSYLVLPRFFSEAETTEMLDRVHTLLNGFDIDNHPMTTFETGDKDKKGEGHVGDDYFLDSGDKASKVKSSQAQRSARLTPSSNCSVDPLLPRTLGRTARDPHVPGAPPRAPRALGKQDRARVAARPGLWEIHAQRAHARRRARDWRAGSARVAEYGYLQAAKDWRRG